MSIPSHNTLLSLGTLFMVLLTSCSDSSTSSEMNPKTTLGHTEVTLEITTWKNDAKSAYSIIFDDYCANSVDGIQDYADTIAANRNIPIGFGIITSECDENEWKRAREMIANGHEAINHTHSHKCGQYFESWCTDTWGVDDFPIEIDQSTQMIASNAGVRPTFFIFPYDLSTQEMRTYLAANEYFGSRTGDKMLINDANFPDAFDLKFDVNFPPDEKEGNQKYTLNELLDSTVMQEGYGIREVHGVDDQSWGVVSAAELRTHLDYANQYQSTGALWVGAPSEVIAYRFARENCAYQVITNLENYTLDFEDNELCKKYPVELTFSIGANLNELIIWQDNKLLPQKINPHDNSKILVDIATDKGEVTFGFAPKE